MIRSHVRAGILFSAVLSASPYAHGALQLYEPFTYAAGTNLTGQTPTGSAPVWIDAYGNGGTDISTVSGSLATPGSVPPAQGNSEQWGPGKFSDRLSINGAKTSGSVYYSFSLKITNLGPLPTATVSSAPAHNAVLLGFNNSNAATGSSNPGTIPATLWIGAGGGTSNNAGSDSADYQLGISVNSATSSRTYKLHNYALNDTLFVVGAYNFGATTTVSNDTTSQLWVYDLTTGDTVPGIQTTADVTTYGTSNGTPTGTPLGGTQNVQSFLLYSYAESTHNRTGDNSQNIDGIRVGTSWSDVVPEPTTLALLGLAVPTILRRRRNA